MREGEEEGEVVEEDGEVGRRREEEWGVEDGGEGKGVGR